MRAVLTIVLVFVMGFLIVATAASKSRNYPRFFKHRTKLREIRGFKPEYISTAIGFGKREDPMEAPDFGRRERIILSLLKNFPRRIPAEVLFRCFPTLANKLTQLSMQNDQDDEESMMGHSKPGRTLALF